MHVLAACRSRIATTPTTHRQWRESADRRLGAVTLVLPFVGCSAQCDQLCVFFADRQDATEQLGGKVALNAEPTVLQTSGHNAVTSVNVRTDAHLGTYWT